MLPHGCWYAAGCLCEDGAMGLSHTILYRVIDDNLAKTTRGVVGSFRNFDRGRQFCKLVRRCFLTLPESTLKDAVELLGKRIILLDVHLSQLGLKT